MKFKYSEFDEAAFLNEELAKDLKDLYKALMLRLGGSPERVRMTMEKLKEKGYIGEDVDIDEFFDKMEEDRLIRREKDSYVATDHGKLKLGETVFRELFSKLRRGNFGQHLLNETGGSAGEISSEKRPYTFGDDSRLLDYSSSLFNTIKRSASLDLMLEEQDLEVYELDRSTDLALVLMIDISHSMILYGEDRITPAKELAMAMVHLVRRYYPRDDLSVVLFGDDAIRVEPREVSAISVGPYHTNTQMGLRKAREILLMKRQVNKQIIMITDGKPSMIKLTDGRYYRNSFGLDPEIVGRTLDEAILCRKRNISITTFMITDDPVLMEFVDKLTKVNMGRAFYCSPDNLGSFVMDTFISHKRQRRKFR